MDDWDDEEVDDVVAKKLTGNWDDEFADIPDSWDAEETKTDQTKAAVPAPAKLSMAERIQLKEEKRRKEKEEKLKREEEARQEQNLSELQRERLAEEAELGLLQDTFGETDATENKGLSFTEPKTKEDFDKLNEFLKANISKFEKSPHYSMFGETLIRNVIVEMDADSLKSVNSAVSALLAEKQKLTKGKSKKKGKSGKLLVERDNDYNVQEDVVLDEYDDFM